MIERIENALQIAVLLACVSVSLYRAAAGRSRMWTLLFFFYGSWVLGDIYWLACLIFFDQTPQISVVSDLSWYASYIFLYMLLRHAAAHQIPGRGALHRLGPAGQIPRGPVIYQPPGLHTHQRQDAHDLIVALVHAVRRALGMPVQRAGLRRQRRVLIELLKAIVGKWHGVERLQAEALGRGRRPGDGKLIIHLVLRVGIDHQAHGAQRRVHACNSFFFAQHGNQPFTLPDAMPDTKYFWKGRNSSTGISAEIMELE